MKRIASILSLALIFALLLAAVAHADTGVVVGLTLEKLGEYPVPSTDQLPEDDRSLIEKAMYIKASAVQYFEDGLYAVAGKTGNVNCFGLFKEDGEQLLPYEAALIKRLNARYLMVYYAMEKTTDKKEALLYISDGFWLGQGLPKEEDTMFKGYAKYYDAALNRFAGDLTASESNTSSGRLLVLSGKGAFPSGIYDENGALVSDERMTAGSGFLYKQREVYDEDLNLRYTSETRLAKFMFASDGAYLTEELDVSSRRVIDIDGNVILPGPIRTVFVESGGVFSVEKLDGSFALMGGDNVEIAASTERFTLLAPGCWYGKDENGYLFVGPDGPVATGLSNRQESSLQVYEKQPDGETRTLVLNSGEWAIPLNGRSNARDVGMAYGRIRLENGENATAFFNLFTGDIMLQGDYGNISRVGHILTAQRGDVCELYLIRCEYQ